MKGILRYIKKKAIEKQKKMDEKNPKPKTKKLPDDYNTTPTGMGVRGKSKFNKLKKMFGDVQFTSMPLEDEEKDKKDKKKKEKY